MKNEEVQALSEEGLNPAGSSLNVTAHGKAWVMFSCYFISNLFWAKPTKEKNNASREREGSLESVSFFPSFEGLSRPCLFY